MTEYAYITQTSQADALVSEIEGMQRVIGAMVAEIGEEVLVAYITSAVFLRSEGERLRNGVIAAADGRFPEKNVYVSCDSSVYFSLLSAVERGDNARIAELLEREKLKKDG